MAAFPSIEPLERSYDLGAHPISVSAFSNGDETRFLHGGLAVGVPLALVFRALGLTQARLISDHFAAHATARPFTIPAHLWRTHTSQTDVVPAGFLWRYSGPPEETRLSGGLFDVSVTLLTVA
jgi:hypothetical protein